MSQGGNFLQLLAQGLEERIIEIEAFGEEREDFQEEAMELVAKMPVSDHTEALGVAVQYGYMPLVVHLLSWEGSEAEITMKMLYTAMEYCQYEVFRYLLQEGAEVTPGLISDALWKGFRSPFVPPNTNMAIRILMEMGLLDLQTLYNTTPKPEKGSKYVFDTGYATAACCDEQLSYSADDVWNTEDTNGRNAHNMDLHLQICRAVLPREFTAGKGPGDVVETPGFLYQYNAGGLACSTEQYYGELLSGYNARKYNDAKGRQRWKVRMARPDEGDPSIPCSLRQEIEEGTCSALKLVLLERE